MHKSHILIVPETCNCDKRSENCPICDYGLSVCQLCGYAESELDKICPKKGKQVMPLPSKKPVAKTAKPAGRTLASLNIPQSSGKSLMVGDAPKTLVEEWFEYPFNKKLDDNDPQNFSSCFDILGAERSHVRDKETGVQKDTVLFLVRSLEDAERYYFFMGSRPERDAFIEAFAEDDTPVLNVRFHRFDTGQIKPFVVIVDGENSGEDKQENGDSEIPF